MKKYLHIRAFAYIIFLIHVSLYAAALIYLQVSNHELKEYISTTEIVYIVYIKFGLFFLSSFTCFCEYRKSVVGIFYLIFAFDMVLSIAIIIIHSLSADKGFENYATVMVLVICQNSFMLLVDILHLFTLCMSIRSINHPKHSSIKDELRDFTLEERYADPNKLPYTNPYRKKSKSKKIKKGIEFNKKGYFGTFEEPIAGEIVDTVVGVSYDKASNDPYIRDSAGEPLTLEFQTEEGSQKHLIIDQKDFDPPLLSAESKKSDKKRQNHTIATTTTESRINNILPKHYFTEKRRKSTSEDAIVDSLFAQINFANQHEEIDEANVELPYNAVNYKFQERKQQDLKEQIQNLQQQLHSLEEQQKKEKQQQQIQQDNIYSEVERRKSQKRNEEQLQEIASLKQQQLHQQEQLERLKQLLEEKQHRSQKKQKLPQKRPLPPPPSMPNIVPNQDFNSLYALPKKDAKIGANNNQATSESQASYPFNTPAIDYPLDSLNINDLNQLRSTLENLDTNVKYSTAPSDNNARNSSSNEQNQNFPLNRQNSNLSQDFQHYHQRRWSYTKKQEAVPNENKDIKTARREPVGSDLADVTPLKSRRHSISLANPIGNELNRPKFYSAEKRPKVNSDRELNSDRQLNNILSNFQKNHYKLRYSEKVTETYKEPQVIAKSRSRYNSLNKVRILTRADTPKDSNLSRSYDHGLDTLKRVPNLNAFRSASLDHGLNSRNLNFSSIPYKTEIVKNDSIGSEVGSSMFDNSGDSIYNNRHQNQYYRSDLLVSRTYGNMM